MILAGDIGGTSTRLALFDLDGKPRDVREYSSQAHSGLEQIVAKYLDETGVSFERAGFGVAGPVNLEDGFSVARGTNVWSVHQGRLAETLKVSPKCVAVINDLAANGMGIDALSPAQFVVLQAGEEKPGHRALVSAGTGLGVGALFWDPKDGRHHPFSSEGGHVNFGPRNELEDGMLKWLRSEDREHFKGHVSWERVLSGPGLFNVFDYLRHANIERQTVEIPADAEPGDAAKKISKAGLDGSCPRSAKTLDIFVSLYGSAAGNAAIQYVAIGGVYLGGGIAPRILPKLKAPAFLEAFLEKQPQSLANLLAKIPVRVILDEHTALRGAARYARLELLG